MRALLLVALASFLPAQASSSADDLGHVPAALRDHMLNGRHGAAVQMLESLRTAQPEHAGLWGLLTGKAEFEAGRHEEALAALRRVETSSADSPWAAKARFLRAEVHRSRGEYKEAEEIFEQAVMHLRSEERQADLAQVYLEHAASLSTPEDERRPGQAWDPAQADQLYAKVLDLTIPRELAEFASWNRIRCSKQFNGDLLARTAEYLNRFDPSRQKPLPANFEPGGRVAEVRLIQARKWIEHGDSRATLELEDLIADLEAGGDPEGKLADAHYDLARAFQSVHVEPAIAAYERYLEVAPAHDKHRVALFAIAELRRGQGRYDLAAEAYRRVRGAALRANESEEERENLVTRSLVLEALSLAADEQFDEAIERYEGYVRLYPNGADWALAQQGIINSLYTRGAWHYEADRFEEARQAWEVFLDEAPLEARAPQVQFTFGSMHVEQAALTEEEGGEPAPHYEQAIEAWERFVSKYPGSDLASQALFSIGVIQENKLGQLEEAIRTYRRCNFGSHASDAAAHVTLMTEPSLSILTERSVRSNEAAGVKLFLRNVDQVEVATYALDLEAYFKKHLTHERIEDLDLDLIAPDTRREIVIDEYAEYAPLEREVDLGVEGPGVWAVTVTSGEMRATTLVVRSDVDVIVKSSRHEVFVFAQDRLSGEVAPGVRVLVAVPTAEGETALEELTTGDDGVARMELEELASNDNVRVLCVREGHYASTGLTLSGLSIAQGLYPRGHLSTDRSVYRPGDTLRFRGILRTVENGSYHFEPGSKCEATVIDSQGRPFHQTELTLSEFGTVSGEVAVPSGAPLGWYTLTLNGPTVPDCALSFQVQQYQPSKIELVLTPEHEVVYRGEEAKVEGRAAYYYGEPVAKAPFTATLPTGRQVEGVTDAKGGFELSFPTKNFVYEQALEVHVALHHEGVQGRTHLWLATRGYSLAVNTPRPVVLAGEPFAVNVAATSPSGEGVARDLVLEVLRRESRRDGTWRDTPVERLELKSDDEGEVHTSLTLATKPGAKGGPHILRVSGADRFGHPILGETTVTISSVDDAVKLRLFADTSRTQVGDALEFELVNRAERELTLLTYEGETILGYEILDLPQGKSTFSLPIDHKHFPNVAVAASMMSDEKLWTASAEFDVERHLNVRVIPGSRKVEPGGEVTVELEVTDQLGRPVRTELSLAAVDASLFDLYPDPTPELKSFFETGARRYANLVTTSSCSFAYIGVTENIAQAVLDEQTRTKARHEWRDAHEELTRSLAQTESVFESLSRNYRGPGDTVVALDELRVLAAGVEGLKMETRGLEGVPVRGSSIEFGAAASAPSGGLFYDDSGVDFYAYAEPQIGRNLYSKRVLFDRAAATSRPATPVFDADTAYWAPDVVTDDTGRAKVTFDLPQKSTRWRLTARGVSADTLVGAGTADFVTRSEFFIELLAPLALVDGDKPQLGARVHNLTGKTGTVRITLTAGEGADKVHRTVSLELGEAPVAEHRFDETFAVAAGDLAISIEAKANLDGEETTDTFEDYLVVYPAGVELSGSKSLTLADEASLLLELPAGARYDHRQLELYVGPTVARSLIDEALRGVHGKSIGGVDHAERAAELIGACAMLDAMQDVSSNPEYAQLRAHAQGLVAALTMAQGSDGGFAWVGTGSSHPMSTAICGLALGTANDAGLSVAPATLDQVRKRLTHVARELAPTAYERRAAFTHALAALDQDVFAMANALHRARHQLAPAALAHTALALHALEREPMAREVASLLEAEIDGSGHCSIAGNERWHRRSVAMDGLAALCLSRIVPGSARLAALNDALMESRPWHRGGGWALAATASKAAEADRANERATVTLQVEGHDPIVIELDGTEAGSVRRLVLPGEGRHARVRARLEGRARPVISATLSGWTRDGADAFGDVPFGFHRVEYRADAPRLAGRALPVGFQVLRDREGSWVNKVDHLPVGRRTKVQIDLWRHDAEMGDSDFLVLEVPLPAGARLLEDSVHGALGQHQIEDGKLVVPVGDHLNGAGVSFTLLGVDPGEFGIRPILLRSAYEPGRQRVRAARSFTVLPRGTASPDEYRPTPDELFHRGQRLFETGDLDGAHAALTQLHSEHEGNLHTDPLVNLAKSLLTTSLSRGDAGSAVRFFEVLREKDPSTTVPFDQIVAIGEAYRDLGEFERAYLIFRATLSETFASDLEVSWRLTQAGSEAGALDLLEELTRVYPNLPAVVEARLGLFDRYTTLAPIAYQNQDLVKADYDRAELTKRSLMGLERFLALHPDSSLAPDAALALVSTYLSMENAERSADLAEGFAGLYSEPRFADAFTYTEAVARWHLGQEDRARALLTQISEAKYTDEKGHESVSENRDLALYILGQIAHAKQDAATAEEYYERVDHLFSDANEALQTFRRRTLALEEVTAARPGEAIALELDHQNIEEVELLVYEVDLMTLYLRERDLAQVTEVNLAGIAPTLTTTVSLGSDRDLHPKESTADLALNEPGAYLVIARSGALHASGLVLVSDIELEVASDPNTQRVRVQAIHAGDGRFLRDVDVRVVGSGGGGFQQGDTDPRGIFSANGVVGSATIVARQGEHYAFHRGIPTGAPAQNGGIALQPQMDGAAYFSNVLDLNTRGVELRNQNLMNEMQRKSDGVRLEQIK